jgi:phosphohistidine phosphatase
MRRLMLLRHAKSDRDTGERDDHARPLNERGREAAALVGRYMHEMTYLPALVLCSTADRARETWKIVRSSFDGRIKVRFEEALYLAEWTRLLDRVHRTEEFSPLLLVGHNPGMQQLAAALAATPKTAMQRKRTALMQHKFSTCTLAVFDFRTKGWASLQPGTGRLRDFVRPKDLATGGD